MEKILPALLECCTMQNVDRMGDMPTKEGDISHVEAKTTGDNEDDEDASNDSETDNYTTLRKSSAYTLQLYSKNFPD